MKFWEWDWRTLAIICMVLVFAVVFARANQAYDGVKTVQKENCLNMNDRNSTVIRALVVLSNAARNREEAWAAIYTHLQAIGSTFTPVAESMIGTNAIEEQSLRELTEYIGDSAIDPKYPNATDPQVRSQSNC